MRKPVPTLIEAMRGQQYVAVEKLLQTIEKEDTQPYRKLAEELLEETDSVSLLSAALKLLTKELDMTPVNITAEAPVRSKKLRSKTEKTSASRFPHRKRNEKSPKKGKHK